MSKTKPLIGISTGDPNGIGIEVILKCYSDKRMYYFGIPIIFSNFNLIQDQLNHLNIDVDLNKIDKIEKANSKKLSRKEVNVIKLLTDFDFYSDMEEKYPLILKDKYMELLDKYDRWVKQHDAYDRDHYRNFEGQLMGEQDKIERGVDCD